MSAAPGLLTGRPMLVLLSAWLTGALAGAMALPHCVAMCGPFAAYACNARLARTGERGEARYLGARTLAYTLLGAIAGGTGGFASSFLAPRWATIALSATLALGMVSLARNLLRAEAPPGLVQIQRKPNIASQEPAVESTDNPSFYARLASSVGSSPALLGALTALFPCGAIYAAVLVAAATASPWAGAFSMLGFAMTSSLALGISSLIARASMGLDRETRRALGAALLLGAAVLVVRPFLASETGPACHTPSEAAR